MASGRRCFFVDWELGIRNQKSEIGNRETGIGNRETGIGNRETGIGNQKSEIGNLGIWKAGDLRARKRNEECYLLQ